LASRLKRVAQTVGTAEAGVVIVTSDSYDLGLIYMNARYYLPEVGRFISPDTLVPDPGNPQSHNRYAYVLNSPVNYTDPSGHRECEIICDGETSSWRTYQDASWTGDWDLEQQAANAAAAETVLTGVIETAAGILWEPVDWALALRDGFQWYDSLGMLPFVPATVGKVGDDAHDLLAKILKAVGLSDKLSASTWREAETLLSGALSAPKNTHRYFVEGMERGRIPDFVTDQFIADAKFYGASSLTDSAQLRDFAALATSMELPLYIYVREGTQVTSRAQSLIESTGGSIIRAFEGP
jgi:RHS repeat-associated protein